MIFDDGMGECVFDIMGCVIGIVVMGGECVFDGLVICIDGIEFDVMIGICVFSGEVCGEGIVLFDGECCFVDEVFMVEVFVGVEFDDLCFDGILVIFILLVIGEEWIIGGCIVLVDGDMDGEIDYDVDWFIFSMVEVGLFCIYVDGFGGFFVGFVVLVIEGLFVD